MRRGLCVSCEKAARIRCANSSSLASFHFERSSLASSTPPERAGLASAMITGPTSSGWYEAIQYAMNPPMLWPTMIGSLSLRERM